MVFLGLLLMLLKVRLPAVVKLAIDNIGDMTGPLSMILIGSTLAEFKLNEVINLDVILVTALRLVVLPLIMLAVLKLLHVDDLITHVAVVLNAMPIATTTVVLAERYKADYHLAAKAVLLSTVLSLLTVPLITLLF